VQYANDDFISMVCLTARIRNYYAFNIMSIVVLALPYCRPSAEVDTEAGGLP
jgi:hypothetical protein